MIALDCHPERVVVTASASWCTYCGRWRSVDDADPRPPRDDARPEVKRRWRERVGQ